MKKTTPIQHSILALTCGTLLLVASGCGDSSPSAPVDNIEKNIKTQQDMTTDLKAIGKKNKEEADAANPMNKKK